MVVSPDAWSGQAVSVHTIIVRDDRPLPHLIPPP
jgi:hypothetical protein